MDEWDVADDLAASVDANLTSHWTDLAARRVNPQCWWKVYRDSPAVFVGHVGIVTHVGPAVALDE